MRRKIIAVLTVASVIGESISVSTNAELLDKQWEKNIIAPKYENSFGLAETNPEHEKWIDENFSEINHSQLNTLGKLRVNLNNLKTKYNEEDLDISEGLTIDEEASEVVLEDLPTEVDNSKLKCFPGIGDQNRLGSCTSFASTYYMLSHMINLQEGRDGSLKENQFSPKWTYNLMNGGNDSGGWVDTNYEIIKSLGAASMAEFPYVGLEEPATNYREWATDSLIWEDAGQYTIESYEQTKLGHISTPDDENLAIVKTKLANGYLLNFSTYWNSWVADEVDDDLSTEEDNQYVGELICKYNDSTSTGGHALTIVGYNDNIWIDINGNSTVDVGEKGAFKVANSWGTEWGNDGFIWLSYDAVNKESAVENCPINNSSRISALKDDNRVMWIIPKEISLAKSDLYGKFTLNTARRNTVKVTLSAVNNITGESYSYTPYAFQGNIGGRYSFDGTTASNDGSFAFDLSKVVEGISDETVKDYTWYLTAEDTMLDIRKLTVKNFSIVNENNKEEYYSYDGNSIILNKRSTVLSTNF